MQYSLNKYLRPKLRYSQGKTNNHLYERKKCLRQLAKGEMKACKILDTKDGILNWFNLIDKGLVGFQLLSTWFIPTCSNCSLSLLMILLCSSISAFSFSSPDKVRFRSSTSSWSTPPCLSLLVSRLWDTNSNKQTCKNKIDFMLLRDYTRHGFMRQVMQWSLEK